MNQELDRLIKFIAIHFPFTEEKYPELVGKGEQERFAFALRHAALHMAKTTGKIATAGERIDHGKEMDKEELEINIVKSLITSLRLAELIGMSESQIIARIEKIYGTAYAK